MSKLEEIKKKLRPLPPNATCTVCGKRYRDANGIHSRPWCSVGCQYSRYDIVDWCEHDHHPELCVKCNA